MPVRILNPWTYNYIRKLADEAAFTAQKQGLRPVLAPEIIRSYRNSKRLNIPFLGDYVPAGWERTGEFGFVDTTGRAAQGDSAMPAFEFFRRVEHISHQEGSDDLGFGVIEIGQTQALVARYHKIK
jgi:hypothetical protein